MMGVKMPYTLGIALYVIGITVNGGCSLWFGWLEKALFCCPFTPLGPIFLNIHGSEKLKVTSSTHSLVLDQGMGTTSTP